MGTEPTGLSGGLGNDAYQDAIADQGSTTRQKLIMQKLHSNDKWMVTCTYIDQNNE